MQSLSRLTDPVHLLGVFKIAVAAGALAGLALGVFHFAATEPVIDRAIALEDGAAAARGEPPASLPYTREQQKVGLVLGTTLLGVALAMVFGLLYGPFRERFPQIGALGASLLLALLVFFVGFLLPFLKYTANPPGVGEPETINYRASIHVLFNLISVGMAMAAFLTWRRFRARLGNAPAGALSAAAFALAMGAAFVLMPGNPDPVTAPPDLVARFRLLSALGLAVLWVSIGLFFGLLWKRSEHRAPA